MGEIFHIRFVKEGQINGESVINKVSDPRHGASVLFLGKIRNNIGFLDCKDCNKGNEFDVHLESQRGKRASQKKICRQICKGPVSHIDYSVYESMAERVTREICEEAVKRCYEDECSLLEENCDSYQLAKLNQTYLKVAIEHKIGRCEVGEVGLAVAVSSVHRSSATLGCDYIVDQLKKRAAIYKCEVFLNDVL